MSLVLSTYVLVSNLCFVGLLIEMVSIAFFAVTGITYPSNLMYQSPFYVFLTLGLLCPIWVSENIVFGSFPSIVASFA